MASHVYYHPKEFILFVLFVSLVSLKIDSANLQETQSVGTWKPIRDPKNPEIVKIGKFAISEHNKEDKTSIEFHRVVTGETQLVAGTKYRLVIDAKDETDTASYEAVVWEKPWLKMRKLVSFIRL